MVQLWNGSVDFSTVPVMVQVTQPIPLGGKRAARRDAASAEADMARGEAAAKARDVEAAVARAYFDLYLADRTIAIDDEIEGTLRSLMAAATARVAAGRGEQSEALRAQAERLKVQSDREAARARRASANARLVALLGRPPGSDIGVPMDPGLVASLPSESELRERALRERPEVGVARSAIAQADAQVRLAEAARVPDIGVFVGEMHAFRMPGVADFLFAGVQANLPIFGDKNRGRIDSARGGLEGRREDARAVAARVGAEVSDAYAEVVAEQRQVELHHQLIPVARQALASATAAYAAGRSTFVMVLDSERDVQMHELDLASHLAMYEQRLADLERAVGADLGLARAAESSQPERH
jgi:cobalt-zinc-cadmium efflux system outer membrane protein